MTNTKKKPLKIILFTLLVLIIAVLAYEAGVWFLSDRIVKLSFNGLENMFTMHDEYYAVAGPFRALIPKALAQTVCSRDVEYVRDIHEESGKVFFVQVNWSGNGRPVFEGTTTLIHSYSNKYVFEVRSPGPDKCVVSRDEERTIIEIAKRFHDFEKDYVRGEDNWVAYTGGSTTIFSFRIYMNGSSSVFGIKEPKQPYKVYSYDNGKLIKIMNVPEKGDFDVVIWKGHTKDTRSE